MWLILQETWDAMLLAERFGISPTAEQQAAFFAYRESALAGDTSRVMQVAGDVARIEVKGVLTQEPNFLAMLFGGGNTTYPEIIGALAEASQDDTVKSAELFVQSPGGIIDGLFETLGAIRAFDKPIVAKVRNTAASAAFAIVSQTDRIIALDKAAKLGSVGIVTSFSVPENVITLTSTMAPKKAPDVTTPEGRKIATEPLDAIHELFAGAIAEGRSAATGRQFDVATINTEFGQGAIVLAGEAVKRGMIDAIEGEPARPALRVVASNTNSNQSANNGGKQPEAKRMDLTTLKTQHPDVYQAAVNEGVALGEQKGVQKERDRVNAHLIMGKNSGAMDTALKAVEDGSDMTASLQATYLSAGMNKRDLNNRAADDAGADPGKPAPTGSDDKGAQVAALVEQQLGIVGGAQS